MKLETIEKFTILFIIRAGWKYACLGTKRIKVGDFLPVRQKRKGKKEGRRESWSVKRKEHWDKGSDGRHECEQAEIYDGAFFPLVRLFIMFLI